MKIKIIILLFISIFLGVLINEHDLLIKVPKDERKLVQISEKTITGKVIHIDDGDSFKMANGKVIRLFGIDAPELLQKCTIAVKVENNLESTVRYKTIKCGEEAKEKLSSIIFNKEINCIIKGKDAYGRLVANCTVKKYNTKTKKNEIININKEMVLSGNAVAFQQISDEYIDDENEAKLENRGIWATNFDLPYIYRRKNRK